MIRLFGSALHNMVSSQIMGQHMLNIEESLWKAMGKQKQDEVKQSIGVNLKEAKGNSQWPQMLSGKRMSMETRIETAMRSGVVKVEADDFDEALACVHSVRPEGSKKTTPNRYKILTLNVDNYKDKH